MAVVFADVSKLFRPHDITCMTAKDWPINDYIFMSNPAGDQMYSDHSNARHVYGHLSGTETPKMPPDVGGEWGQAKLALYLQWMNDGFQ